MNNSTTTLINRCVVVSAFYLLSGSGFFLLVAAAQAAGFSEPCPGKVVARGKNHLAEMTLSDEPYRHYLIPAQSQCIATTPARSWPSATGGTNPIGGWWQASKLTTNGMIKNGEAKVANATIKRAGNIILVAGDPLPQLSTTGIGEARFGMTVSAAEQALGRKLEFEKKVSDRQIKAGLCVPATINGLPGIVLAFTKGRLDGISSDKPSVTTKSGLKVGDPEAAVIKRFQGDPTYKRSESRHEGKALMEITLGKSSSPTDTSLMFQSRRGAVTSITAGHSGYVYDSDYCAQ